MIYNLPALDTLEWPVRAKVGQIPADANTRRFSRAATVLSNMRWAATFAYGAGVTFSAAQIYFYMPFGSTGRCAPQVIIQSPNTLTLSTGIKIQTMSGSSTYTTFSGTSATLTNPTDLRGTTGGTWRCGARMYPGNTTYALLGSGCGRVMIDGLTATSPLGVSVICYPYPGYASSSTSAYTGYRYGGGYTSAWPDTAFTPLTAAWARSIEEQLEVAEAMPIVLAILPGHVTGVSGRTTPWVGWEIRERLCRQIPLAPPRRPKAYVVAEYGYNSTIGTFNVLVGAQLISSWTSVYSSNNYRVYKARLTDAAYTPVGTVGGCPIVNCECRSRSNAVYALSAWITEDW